MHKDRAITIAIAECYLSLALEAIKDIPDDGTREDAEVFVNIEAQLRRMLVELNKLKV